MNYKWHLFIHHYKLFPCLKLGGIRSCIQYYLPDSDLSWDPRVDHGWSLLSLMTMGVGRSPGRADHTYSANPGPIPSPPARRHLDCPPPYRNYWRGFVPSPQRYRAEMVAARCNLHRRSVWIMWLDTSGICGDVLFTGPNDRSPCEQIPQIGIHPAQYPPPPPPWMNLPPYRGCPIPHLIPWITSAPTPPPTSPSRYRQQCTDIISSVVLCSVPPRPRRKISDPSD